MPPMSSTDFLYGSLQRIESATIAGFTGVNLKLDDHAHRLTRVEALLEERTVRHARRPFVSRGAMSTGVSVVAVAVWKIVTRMFR